MCMIRHCNLLALLLGNSSLARRIRLVIYVMDDEGTLLVWSAEEVDGESPRLLHMLTSW